MRKLRRRRRRSTAPTSAAALSRSTWPRNASPAPAAAAATAAVAAAAAAVATAAAAAEPLVARFALRFDNEGAGHPAPSLPSGFLDSTLHASRSIQRRRAAPCGPRFVCPPHSPPRRPPGSGACGSRDVSWREVNRPASTRPSSPCAPGRPRSGRAGQADDGRRVSGLLLPGEQDSLRLQQGRPSRQSHASALRHRHVHRRSGAGAGAAGARDRLLDRGHERRAGRLCVPAAGPLRAGRVQPHRLPTGGGVPQHEPGGRRLPAARVRHLRRRRRPLHPAAARRSAHAGRLHPAHGAEGSHARAEGHAAEAGRALRPAGGAEPQGRGVPAGHLRGPRGEDRLHPPRHPRRPLRRPELLQGPVRRRGATGHPHVRAALAQQGHRAHGAGAAGGRGALSRHRLHRPGRHASARPAPRRRVLPAVAAAAGQDAGGGRQHPLPEPVRRRPGAERVARGDRRLRHALRQRGPDLVGHPGLRGGQRQGRRLDARTGTPPRCWPRSGAVSCPSTIRRRSPSR